MVPKKILVATDGSEHASAALETALILAERFSSSLGILYAVNVRQLEGPFLSDLSGMVGMVPFLNFQSQVRELLTNKGKEVLSNQLEVCRARGVPAETQLAEGVVSRVICKVGKAYDLICLGRHGEHAPWSGLMMGSTVEEVVRGSSRPVLVASRRVPSAMERLLLAYDGSQTASASLALAVDMADALGSGLTILTVGNDEEEGRRLLDEARRYVEPRTLSVRYLHRGGEPVAGIVEAAAAEADLVIMGAYGHSRLRQLFLGSTTAGVLSAVEVPVLLYR